jgi:hypothetical protein
MRWLLTTARFARPVAKHFSRINHAWPEKWIARNRPSAAANTHKIKTSFLTAMIFPPPSKAPGRVPNRPGGKLYELLGNVGGTGFGALSPISHTCESRSDICMPERLNSAGTCAAIWDVAGQLVGACSAVAGDTMVTLSTLLSGSDRARTTSGRLVISLSTTAPGCTLKGLPDVTLARFALLKMLGRLALARVAEARPAP